YNSKLVKMIERKCPKCSTWNGDETHCKSCGTVISPEILQKIEDDEKAKKLAEQKPDKLDVLLSRAKNHRLLPVRILYYMIYSVAVVVFAIASFFAYLVAWSPG